MWRGLRVFGYVAAAVALGGVGVLFGQAQQARRDIPRAQAPPPRATGRYGVRRGGTPLTMVMLGDSSAAGYGVQKRRETPGALLATGVSRRLGRPVDLHCLAVVGATSPRLAPQLETALELRPALAVIMIGGNDVTHRIQRSVAVRHLMHTVHRLREAGTEVVVGTCPDLGTVQPIRRPLRWVARQWSRRLAAAQTVAVVAAGGWTVSLGDLLGPRFAAEPYRMFGVDRFHPSADGYAAAAAALLPTSLAALGAVDSRALPGRQGVVSLPRAAVEASRQAGTEVRGAAGWALLRAGHIRWAALRRAIRPAAHPPIPQLLESA